MLPNHHIKKTVALALTLGAIAPAGASAKEIGTTPFGERAPRHLRPRSSASAPRPAGSTGQTLASAPPAASRSRCSASVARWSSHRTDAHSAPSAPQPDHLTDHRNGHTMPTLKSSPLLPNKHRNASRAAAVALVAVIAIAVTVLILALPGAHATLRAARPRTPASPPPTPRRSTTASRRCTLCSTP